MGCCFFFLFLRNIVTRHSEHDRGCRPPHGKTLEFLTGRGEGGGGDFSMCDTHVPLYLHLWSVKLFHGVLSLLLWSRTITKANEGQSFCCLQVKSFGRHLAECYRRKQKIFLVLLLMFQLLVILMRRRWTDTNWDGGPSCRAAPLQVSGGCFLHLARNLLPLLAWIFDSKRVECSVAAQNQWFWAFVVKQSNVEPLCQTRRRRSQDHKSQTATVISHESRAAEAHSYYKCLAAADIV